MRKFTALLLILVQASRANAFGWDDVSSFTSSLWDKTAACFSEWFGGNDDDTATENSDVLPDDIAENWRKLSGNLNDALALRDKQETLPDSAWFGEDKISNGQKINALLDKALVILSDSDTGNARADALRLRERLDTLRTEIDTLRNDRIDAPDKTYIPWRDTKSKIDAKISEAEREISRIQDELAGINAKVADELAKIGITLTGQQADILINSVTGGDIIQNTIIFENVKAVVAKLEELSQKDTNNNSITKRYAGMYLVLNDILIHTQEELIRKMDSEYRPKLADIIKEAETLRKQAISRSNNKSYTPQQRRSFALNAKSNADTIKAARLYGQLLDAQRLSLLNSIHALRMNRDLAENTYRTIRSSGELRGLIHSGLDAIDAVMRLSMPELKIFEGNTLRAEFDEINRRLKRE